MAKEEKPMSFQDIVDNAWRVAKDTTGDDRDRALIVFEMLFKDYYSQLRAAQITAAQQQQPVKSPLQP